jgi:long-chain fatty acid transport protein
MKIFKKFLSIVVLMLFLAPYAFSAGFHVNVEQGMKAMGLGGAFVGLADDPTALYYNPAGITQLDGKFNFATTYTFGLFHPKLHNPSIVDAMGNTRLTSSTKYQDTRWAQIPSMYLTYKINDKLTAGFAFFAPFGTATDWTHTWIGRYFADKTELRTYDFNPTLAYKLSDKFSVAFGINYVYSTVEIKKSISFPMIAYKQPGLTVAQQLSLYNLFYNRNYDVDVKLKGDTDSSGKGWGFNVGLLFKPNDEWQIGAIYRSEVVLDFKGHASYNYMPGAITLGAPAVIKRSPISASITLPDYLAIGIVNKSFKNWTLLFDFYWTGWSDYKSLDVKFDDFAGQKGYVAKTRKDWNDVIALRFGAQYQIDNWAFRVGYMHDESPTKDSTRGPELACSDRNDVTFGVGYKYKNFNVDFAYLLAFFKEHSSKLVDETTGTQLKGDWSTIAHVLGVTLSCKF